MNSEIAVLLYPGCIFFEIALATETLAVTHHIRYYTPDGRHHQASNAALIPAAGSYHDLAALSPCAVLIPGGDPREILVPTNVAAEALNHAARVGSVLAGICAGSLVLAASGLLVGHRATHNYTAEHAPPEKVQATAPHWEGMRFERADLVHDGLVITAQPWAYRQFAAAVAQALGVLSDASAKDLIEYPTRRTTALSAAFTPRLSEHLSRRGFKTFDG